MGKAWDVRLSCVDEGKTTTYWGTTNKAPNRDLDLSPRDCLGHLAEPLEERSHRSACVYRLHLKWESKYQMHAKRRGTTPKGWAARRGGITCAKAGEKVWSVKQGIVGKGQGMGKRGGVGHNTGIPKMINRKVPPADSGHAMTTTIYTNTNGNYAPGPA